MIKNIVFDIGNVLVDFCWQDHIARFGYPDEISARVGRAMMQSPVWNELDRGVWTNDELLAGFIANDPELEPQIREVFLNLSTLVRRREGSVGWLRSLKKDGYRVYYLSNFSKRVRTEAAREMPFLKEMDGGIMSCDVKLIKPDEAIYRTLFARYGLNPGECVFLDDSPKNLETAKRLGMKEILVKDQGQAIEELAEYLREDRKRWGRP